MPSLFREIELVSPAEYEKAVREMLDSWTDKPGSYESQLLETVKAIDGEYVIDVTARFSILGVDILMLVECKRHRRKVERADLQVLQQKLQSTGAHKGGRFLDVRVSSRCARVRKSTWHSHHPVHGWSSYLLHQEC